MFNFLLVTREIEVCISNQQTLAVLQHCRARCEEVVQFLSCSTDSVNGQDGKDVIDAGVPLVADSDGLLVFSSPFGCVSAAVLFPSFLWLECIVLLFRGEVSSSAGCLPLSTNSALGAFAVVN
jgi:hypothetical protein